MARVRRLWPWAPLALAAVWLVALGVDFRSVVDTIYANAEVASGPVIGELYGERGDGQVVLGHFPWYSTLWFEQLTGGLPAHRQVWELGPWLFFLLGVAAVSWATWRVAGRWPAMIVAVLLACAGPSLLAFQFGGSGHGPAFAFGCFLGAFLVLLVARGGVVGSPPVHVALCAAMAAITAVGFAGDLMLLPAGIAPFALASLAAAWLLPRAAARRVAVSAVAISLFAVLVGRGILVPAMEEAEVVSAPCCFELRFAEWDQLIPNLRLLAQSLAILFNGDFGGADITPRSVLELVCALAVLAAAVLVARHARHWLPAALAAPTRDGDEATRTVHLVFWLLAAGFLTAAFLLSNVPMDRESMRYVVGIGAGIAVVIAIAAVRRTWARALVVVGVSAVLTSGIAGLVRGDITDNPDNLPTGGVSGQLERLARAEGVDHGYAGYWTAAPVTWRTKAALRLYPVQRCADDKKLCPYNLHRIDDWYSPRAGEGSLLVIDPLQPRLGAPTGPLPAFGRPRRVARVAYMTVYVYDHDIASRLGPLLRR